MYNYAAQQNLLKQLKSAGIKPTGNGLEFHTRFTANLASIHALYAELYAQHRHEEAQFDALLQTICKAFANRPDALKNKDLTKQKAGDWFLSQKLAGMSLYVDRFCGKLKNMPGKLDYFKTLGVNFLHLMPVFESPAGESDGGYAVSNFRKVDDRFGTLTDLQKLQQQMQQQDMYLMIDIVLNHTSHRHEWAEKAKAGDKTYEDFFYFYDDRNLPNAFEETMPEVFPEVAPGSFTYVPELEKWVMTVFHQYQWDLNYTNPQVLVAMLDTVFFYANLGIDVLRIDAPAFIWKQLGTTCQNLPQAHTLLRLIRLCVQVAAPGMALLGEAIVDPENIMQYFGTGAYTAAECDVAYNATHMALQWDMLATGDTRIMLAAQHILLRKPLGCTWLTYTRCHDDIGLGYDDSMIAQAGFQPYEHRRFLKDYYSGSYDGSPANGALFSVNEKTGDARISGTLASLCGLEKALESKQPQFIDQSIKKILLMQAHSFFLGGIPMLFYGDETGQTNDYSYQNDSGKSYDNRWMHRPIINWKKNARLRQQGTIEEKVFEGTKRLLAIRSSLPAIADKKNLVWISPYNIHVAGYLRYSEDQRIFCLFNFSDKPAWLTWYALKEKGNPPQNLYDHWGQRELVVGSDREHLVLEPYEFYILEPK